MAHRADLLLEVDEFFPSSGNYVGPWLDSAAVYDIRVLHWTTSGAAASIEQSSDEAVILTTTALGTLDAEVRITTRFFRITSPVSGNSRFRAVIRALP